MLKWNSLRDVNQFRRLGERKLIHSILTKAGVVQARDQWNVEDFVRSEVASIV